MFHPLILLFLFLAATFAHAQTPTPGERLRNEWVEISVPASAGWKLAPPSSGRIALARSGREPDDSIVGFALVFPMERPRDREHFLELVRTGAAADTPPERFTERQVDVRHDDSRSTWCVRHASVHDDRQARLRSGGTGTLMLQALMLYCLHPQEPGLAVAIGFSHRGRGLLPDFDSEATAFIESARILKR
jgi:hypothetical protein